VSSERVTSSTSGTASTPCHDPTGGGAEDLLVPVAEPTTSVRVAGTGPQLGVAEEDLAVVGDVVVDVRAHGSRERGHGLGSTATTASTVDVSSSSVVRMISTRSSSLLGKW